MAGDNLLLPPDLSRIESDQFRRLYARERRVRPRTPGSANLSGQLGVGIIQDGHSYVFDEVTGQARPSAPQNIPFSWPGTVITGPPSGPHLVVLPNISKIYLVTLAVGTVDPDDDITVEYSLNGTNFTSLTLAPSARSTLARYDSSWPALGGNASDVIQVQCTAAGSVGADLVAAVRIV